MGWKWYHRQLKNKQSIQTTDIHPYLETVPTVTSSLDVQVDQLVIPSEVQILFDNDSEMVKVDGITTTDNEQFEATLPSTIASEELLEKMWQDAITMDIEDSL